MGIKTKLVFCDICGVSSTEKNISYHTLSDKMLCDKHRSQYKTYGKFMDNNKRCIFDSNDIHIVEDYAMIDLYDKFGNIIYQTQINIEDIEKSKLHKRRKTNMKDVENFFDKTKIRGFEIVADTKRKDIEWDITLPQRADFGSCAYDFYSPCYVELEPNQQTLIWTDVKAYMLKDEVLLLNVRSSQGKPRIQLANTQGWVDSTYYSNPDNDGNIGIFLRNEGTLTYIINKGDRICQGMFTNYLVTDDDKPLSQSRLSGFGSSGR